MCSEIAQYDNISLWRCSANILIRANISFGTVKSLFSALFLTQFDPSDLSWFFCILIFVMLAQNMMKNADSDDIDILVKRMLLRWLEFTTLGVANRLKGAQMQPNLPYPNILECIANKPICESWDYWQCQYELATGHINTNMSLSSTDSNPYFVGRNPIREMSTALAIE